MSCSPLNIFLCSVFLLSLPSQYFFSWPFTLPASYLFWHECGLAFDDRAACFVVFDFFLKGVILLMPFWDSTAAGRYRLPEEVPGQHTSNPIGFFIQPTTQDSTLLIVLPKWLYIYIPIHMASKQNGVMSHNDMWTIYTCHKWSVYHVGFHEAFNTHSRGRSLSDRLL